MTQTRASVSLLFNTDDELHPENIKVTKSTKNGVDTYTINLYVLSNTEYLDYWLNKMSSIIRGDAQ